MNDINSDDRAAAWVFTGREWRVLFDAEGYPRAKRPDRHAVAGDIEGHTATMALLMGRMPTREEAESFMRDREGTAK